MDNSFTGSDNEDFVLNGGNSKLAKLFENETKAEVNLKYKAPKEPNMKSLHSGRSSGPVHLKVVIGKTVEAFKTENGKYKSYGKVGAAILGSDDRELYQLYVYRSDERKVTNVDIDCGFHFLVHPNNYALFRNRFGEAWSLHFDKAADLAEFSREVALAKWRSPNGSLKKLIQDTVFGNEENRIRPHDTVTALYRVFPLDEEKTLGKELQPRTLSSAAESSIWESNVVGACSGTSRIIILPHSQAGDWASVVPSDCDVFLEMEIKEVKMNILPKKEIAHPSSSLLKKRDKFGENDSQKPDILSRISKMGQPLLPFPGFPCKDSDSEQNEVAEINSIESFRSQGNITDRLSPSSISFPSSANLNFESREHVSFIKPIPYCMSDDSNQSSIVDNMVNAQFNVLFSEIRTSNAEMRMNMTRLSDRVESISYKLEKNNEIVTHKMNCIISHLDSLISSDQDMKSSITAQLNGITDQNQIILPFLTKSQSTKSPDNSEEMRERIYELETRNHDLESYLKKAERNSNMLQVKVQELKDHLNSVEKHNELIKEDREKTDHCSHCQGHGEENIKHLENRIEAVEARNRTLEKAKSELENENIMFEKKLLKITKEKDYLEKSKNYEIEETLKRLRDIEDELFKSRSSLKDKEDRLKDFTESPRKTPSKDEVSEIVKKVMNMTYSSLKKQLIKEENGEAPSIKASLAHTLRVVTNSYLSQLSDSGCSSEESSSPRGAPDVDIPIQPPLRGPASNQSDLGSSINLDESKENSSFVNSESSNFPVDTPLPKKPVDNPMLKSVSTVESSKPSNHYNDEKLNGSFSGAVCFKPIPKPRKDPIKPTEISTEKKEEDCTPLSKNSFSKDGPTRNAQLSKPTSAPGVIYSQKSANYGSKGNVFHENVDESNKSTLADESSSNNPGFSERITTTKEQNLEAQGSKSLEAPTGTVPDSVLKTEIEPAQFIKSNSTKELHNKSPSCKESIHRHDDQTSQLGSNVSLSGIQTNNPDEVSASANASVDFRERLDSREYSPVTFVPIIRPEPPPILSSRSPSPSRQSLLEGCSLSDTLLNSNGSTPPTKRSKSHDVWRSQPPPLFDDEGDTDDWLL